MLRIICVAVEYGRAANVGGPPHTEHKTFEVDAPAVEAWLREKGGWQDRSVVGIEVTPEPAGLQPA
jgi:hypothetical protein